MRLSLALLLVLSVAMVGCVNVKMQTLDRQMQIEKQIIGQLKRLESELILASSIRAKDTNQVIGNEESIRAELIDVQQNRLFREDDIEALKEEKKVAERSDGLVKAISKLSAKEKKLLSEENKDRSRLFKALVAADATLTTKDLPLVKTIFARLQRKNVKQSK